MNEKRFLEMLSESEEGLREAGLLAMAQEWARTGDLPPSTELAVLVPAAQAMAAWTAWRTQVAYSMPCLEAIEAIEEHAPRDRAGDGRTQHLVEIGAGLGIWTAILRARALVRDPDHPGDFVATDDAPRPGTFTHVARLGATRSVEGWPERDVLVASPSYGPDLPFGAALAMAPGRLLFWYEGAPQRVGYQGAVIFARMLAQEFEPEGDDLELDNLWGTKDVLSIHRRLAR